jgi:hypothetical protein
LLDPPTAYVEQSPNALMNTPLLAHGVPAVVGADVPTVTGEPVIVFCVGAVVGAKVARVGADVGWPVP